MEFSKNQIDQLIDIAKQAGRETLKYYNNEVQVESKADDSPVTAADMAAHEVIVAWLEKYTPEIPVISEESGVPDYETRKSWSRFWIVDPLDGTKEFIKQLDEFTINIALIEEGQPVLGIIYVPALDTSYWGAKDKGAFKIDPNGTETRIYSELARKEEPLVVAVSRSHGSEKQEAYLSELQVRDRISAGSSLKFCLVAEGKADIYPRLGPTMEWDVAAGDAIYRYSAKEGEHSSPLTYNKPDLKNGDFVVGFAD